MDERPAADCFQPKTGTLEQTLTGRFGFFGERSGRNWKMRQRGLTLAASGTIKRVCYVSPPFLRGLGGASVARILTTREDEAGCSNSNSRFNRVFNWATVNHWSLFARGFALQILGRPPLLFLPGNRSLRPITRIYELDFCPVLSDILSESEWNSLILIFPRIIANPPSLLSLSPPPSFNEIYLLLLRLHRRIAIKGELFFNTCLKRVASTIRFPNWSSNAHFVCTLFFIIYSFKSFAFHPQKRFVNVCRDWGDWKKTRILLGSLAIASRKRWGKRVGCSRRIDNENEVSVVLGC